jgi:maltose/moltooligosaccharide transporter
MNFKPENLKVGTLTYTGGGLIMVCFWLLLGDFGIMMRERAITPTVTAMLLQHHTAPWIIILLTMVLPSIIALFVIIPLAYQSDRYRGPKGRRIPYLMWSTPLAALGLVILAFSPVLGAQLHLLLGDASPGVNPCFLIFFAIAWTIFEVGGMLTLTLFPALINDVVPKGVLGRFYGAYRIVGLASGFIFMFWAFKYAKTNSFEILIGLAVLFGVGFMFMCLKVKEGEYPPAEAVSDGLVANTKHFIKDSFSLKYYWWIIGFVVLSTMSFTPFNAVTLLYSNSLGITDETYGEFTAYAWLTSAAIAFCIGWMVDKIGVFPISSIFLLLFVSVALGGYFFISDKNSFLTVYVLHTIFSGAYMTAAASLPMRLYPRLKFSQFASAVGIVAIPVTITYNSFSAWMLDYTNNNYRLTLIFASAFAFLGLILLLVVWRNYGRRPEAVRIADGEIPSLIPDGDQSSCPTPAAPSSRPS